MNEIGNTNRTFNVVHAENGLLVAESKEGVVSMSAFDCDSPGDLATETGYEDLPIKSMAPGSVVRYGGWVLAKSIDGSLVLMGRIAYVRGVGDDNMLREALIAMYDYESHRSRMFGSAYWSERASLWPLP